MARRTTSQMDLLRAGLELGARKSFDHVLYIGDMPLPEDLIVESASLRKKLVQAVTNDAQRAVIQETGIRTLLVPAYDIPRQEKFKIALVSGISAGLFKRGDVILGLVGKRSTAPPDTVLTTSIGDGSNDDSFIALGEGTVGSSVLESLIDLAVTISVEGWEGHPIGTIFVVGDSANVLEKSSPLTLNPFQGYSEAEKNVLNPEVRDAIKNFAVLDGAFVIREDGVVLAAGRYLNIDEAKLDVPLGLGARHLAAAGISRDTEALALAVSQTSGKVRVFRGGKAVLEIDPKTRRR